MTQLVTMAAMAAATAAKVVVEKIAATSATVPPAAPLKPYQPNQRMNTPRAPSVMLWPGMALDLPLASYLPMRAPRNAAPMKAMMPPTMWITAEPAQSRKPSSESQPPPQTQWVSMG